MLMRLENNLLTQHCTRFTTSKTTLQNAHIVSLILAHFGTVWTCKQNETIFGITGTIGLFSMKRDQHPSS